MMNNCSFIGRLAADPEVRQTNTGKTVCNITVAVDRGRKDQDGNKACDFVRCVLWEKTAEVAEQYTVKGDLVGVSGRMECRKYKDKDGNNRESWELQVNPFGFDLLQSKGRGAQGTPSAGAQPAQHPAQSSMDDYDPFAD